VREIKMAARRPGRHPYQGAAGAPFGVAALSRAV